MPTSCGNNSFARYANGEWQANWTLRISVDGGGKMSRLVDQLEEMRARINSMPLTPNNSPPALLGNQVNQMRTRVKELAKVEGQMVSDLSSALRHLDDLLLHEVRSIAAQHESRRANVLNELQSLATQLNGSYPPASRHVSPATMPGTLLENSQTAGSHYSFDQDRQQRLRDALIRQLANRAAQNAVELVDTSEDAGGKLADQALRGGGALPRIKRL